MDPLYSYFLKSVLLMSVLYSFYWLMLRRDTFYKTNRYYLILSLVTSAIVPLFQFSIPQEAGAVYGHLLEPVVITPENFIGIIPGYFEASNAVITIYLLGASLFFSRLVIRLLQLAIIVRRYGITKYKGLNLVVMNKPYEPFSMFNLVFVNHKMLEEPDFDRILEHERTHVNQGHTLDLLILELFQVIQWFNPLMWLYRRSLKSIHEFLADEKVLSKGYTTLEYQKLLLNQTFRVQKIPLTHNFNHSLIKKRFIMMSKEKSKKIEQLKLVLILPAAILFAALVSITFSGPITGQPADPFLSGDEELSARVLNQAPIPQEDPVFTVVEKVPEYPGGKEALFKYMSENIKYPENARKNGIQGKVFVTFIIEKSGKVTNTRVLKSVNEELDKEALRVVNEMPNWRPGTEKGKPVRVQFTLPIDYKLDGDKKPKEESGKPKKTYQDVKPIDK